MGFGLVEERRIGLAFSETEGKEEELDGTFFCVLT